MSNHLTPIRTKSQKVGDLGEVETARVLLKWGWTAEPISSDYGEDLDCNIFFDFQRTKLHFRCQVKSTYKGSGQVRLLNNGDYSVSISSTILRIWMRSYYPVILTVYDDSNGKIFWLNATVEISKVFHKLSQKTVTLHVSRKQELVNGKEEIIESIVSYYSDILRLSNTKITCNIIPILMPGYLGCGISHWIDWLNETNWGEIKAAPIFLTQEALPSWATSIQLLEPTQGIMGIKATLSTNNPEDFFNTIIAKLPTFQPPRENPKWVSYIFSPLILIGDTDGSQKNETFWSRELTGWTNYVCVDERIVPEEEYIFARPEQFLTPIGKASGFGWSLYPHVSRNLDLALRFFAGVEVTSAYRSETLALQQIYESQYLPWVCSVDELHILDGLLQELGLGFMIIDELSTESIKVGAICTHSFDPQMQLYTAPHYWSERIGGIRLRLDDYIDTLPGEEEPSNVNQYLAEQTKHILKTDHIQYLIMEHDKFIPGLPTELTERVIEATRYRVVPEGFDEENGAKILKNLVEEITKSFPEDRNISADIYLFQDMSNLICRLAVSWKPSLNDSSSHSFNQIYELILRTFNQILPKHSTHKSNKISDTYSIFQFNGAVVFEDDLDYFKNYYVKQGANS